MRLVFSGAKLRWSGDICNDRIAFWELVAQEATKASDSHLVLLGLEDTGHNNPQPVWRPGRGITHSADAVHTDVPLAGLAGCPVHHGLPVLVVEVLPLGNAVQFTLVWG